MKATMTKTFTATAAACALLGAQTGVASPEPNPPVDASFEVTLPPDPAWCPFQVTIVAEGRGKTIMLPGNRLIATSPQLKVTFINTLTGKSHTQSATGAFHSTVDGVGTTTYTSTGQSLLGDPTTGLVFVSGRFTWVMDANGTLVKPLSGVGRMTSACALVS